MRMLREGDWGAEVELLQLGLRRWQEDAPSEGAPSEGVPSEHTDSLATDGIFGARTQQALKRWQAAQNLATDGIAGEQTWQSLLPYLRGYFQHTVQPGDTLLKLAANYESAPSAIATANPNIDFQRLPPGAQLVVPRNELVVPTNIRWCSSLLALVLEGLCARYPFLHQTVIGHSVLGRPIYQVSIGGGSQKIGYNAAHHANEWITTPVLLKFLEHCAAGLAHGGLLGGVKYERVFDDITLDIVPMVNPDGAVFA